MEHLLARLAVPTCIVFLEPLLAPTALLEQHSFPHRLGAVLHQGLRVLLLIRHFTSLARSLRACLPS